MLICSVSVVLWYLVVVNTNEAARILAIFSTPSISHQIVFRPLTQELAKRGHEVVIITPDPVFSTQEPPANLTEIDVHDISYDIWRQTFMATSKGNEKDLLGQMQTYLDAVILLVDAQLNDKRVKNILQDKTQKFDLILTEACVRPALVFSYIYKAPLIQVSSFGASFDNYATIGAPGHPLLYPAVTRQRLNNLNMWEKVKELYNTYKLLYLYEKNKQLEHKMLKKHFGNTVPYMDELNNNVDMLFLNVHPIFEGNRPVPPAVVYMGGLHQKPLKELPPELKSYLDSSKTGVIYLSFGTNVDPSVLPRQAIQTLVTAFSKLSYDILWKWNKDDLPGRTNNIKTIEWVPQSDVLNHPKIKLFITQGGLQSTDEAITAGVPMIGMPMLGDQWYNVEKYEYHKIGIRLDMKTFTVEKLVETINTIVEDDSYRCNIIRLRQRMRDEPTTPMERAIWWTEYVMRHGGAKHLRAPAANISWVDYLEIELVSTILVLLVAITVSCIAVAYYIYKFTLGNIFTVKFKSA